jgi:hypothetical protein
VRAALALGVSCLALAACATSAAQRAFDDGDDVVAARLADEDAKARPGDEGALALRQRARDHAATRELSEMASFRANGHVDAALASLDRLLKQLAEWGGPGALSRASRAALDREVEASRAFVRNVGADACGAGHPLAAQAELARLAPLLAHAELADARDAATARVRDTGRQVCARVQGKVSSNAPNAHFGVVVARYCAHFDVTFEPPPLTDGLATFELTGAVSGPAKGATERVHARVGDWLRASAWYERGGRGSARGSVQGKLEATVEHRTVQLHAPYHDRIVTETGTTEKSAALPTELRAFLDKNSATSVTEVDRDYAYEAEEHRGHYDLGVKVTLDLGAAPVTFTLQRVENLKGYEHSAAFAPAGVEPRHETVPSPDEWLDRQLERMSTKAIAVLNHKFVATYCAPGATSLEDASRCVAAGQRTPAAVRAVAEAFGENADQLLPLLRPPAPPAPPGARAPAPKPKPRVEDDENVVID